MLGIVYAIGWLFNTVKDTIKDVCEDFDGRKNHKINENIYTKGTELHDVHTGHQIHVSGDKKYYDFSTGLYYRPQMTAQDYERETKNKEVCSRKGYSVYQVSACRLPVNVEGNAWMDMNNGRLYTYRKIYQKGFKRNPEFRLNAFLVSVNEDNYGEVERLHNGNPLPQVYANELKDKKFNLSVTSDADDEWGWSIR